MANAHVIYLQPRQLFRYVVNMNAKTPLSINIQLAEISPDLAADSRVRDVWRHADDGATKAGVYKISNLPPHDSVFVVLNSSTPPPPPPAPRPQP